MKVTDGNNYPEIKIERPNIDYAKILMQDYAGEVSEDTAINLYMYQSIMQNEKWDKFSEVIEKIAVVEMNHLELLGKTILKLGLNPIFGAVNFETNNTIFWSSDNVDYTDKIKSMLQVDIKSENLAIKQYELHKEIIDDKYIKALLERIIQDEKEHLKIFRELYNIVENNEY